MLNGCSLDNLPLEVLERIYNFLSISDQGKLQLIQKNHAINKFSKLVFYKRFYDRLKTEIPKLLDPKDATWNIFYCEDNQYFNAKILQGTFETDPETKEKEFVKIIDTEHLSPKPESSFGIGQAITIENNGQEDIVRLTGVKVYYLHPDLPRALQEVINKVIKKSNQNFKKFMTI